MRYEKIFANIIIQLMILLPLEISMSFAAPPVITDFSVTTIDNTKVMANFTTDQNADTRINFGFDTNVGMLEQSFNLVINHSYIITGLNADTLYYFKAYSQNAGAEEGESAILQATTYRTNSILSVNLTGLKDEPIDSVDIDWESSADSNSILYYGNESDNLNRQLSDAAETRQHSMTLAGLEPGKTYYYKVKSSYVESSVDSFVAPVDITIPTLVYTRPAEYTTNSTLFIDGSLSENATVELRANGYLISQQKFAPGSFNVTTILSQGKNRIQLKATDDYDNSFIDNFNVTVDSQPPVITLVNFDMYAPFAEKNITVITDEDAKITVKLNNVSVEATQNYVRTLNRTLRITRDDNVLEIDAQDAAGNIGILTQTITRLKDLQIEMMQPNLTSTLAKEGVKVLGRNKYEIHSGNTLKLIGRTNPGATVKIWRTYEEEITGDLNVTPDYEATADASTGVFIIDVSIPDIATREDYQKYRDYYKNLGGGDYETYTVQFQVNLQATYYLRITAEDSYGRKNTEGPISLRVVKDRCGSPMYPWIVDVEPDTHSFKPYRLIDGHELLQFNIHLSWIGIGENEKVIGVTVKPQTITPEMRYGPDNESYACITEGKIFPKTPKAHSFDQENKTNWFLLYKLQPWEGLNDTMVSRWSDAFKHLANKKCRMELKVEVKYEYYDPFNETIIHDTQEYCFPQVNIIQDQVDPRMVMPEWLLEGGIKFIDTAITVLGSTQAVVKIAYDVARWTCWGLTIDYAIQNARTKYKCLRVSKTTASDTEVLDAADAQSCADKIQSLKILYNKYRLACDRIWCKSAPSDPSNPNSKAVGGIIKGEEIETQPGAPSKTVKCESVDGYVCVERQTMYSYYCGSASPICYESSDCNSAAGAKTEQKCCCRRTNEKIDGTVQEIKDETVTFKDDKNFLEGGVESHSSLFGLVSNQWLVSPGNKKWNFGIWAGFGDEQAAELVKDPVSVGAVGLGNAQKKQTQLKSLVEAKIGEPGTGKDTKYDTYISGVNAPSCFNQNPWFDSKRLYLKPSQNFLDSIQCACVSDIYGRTAQWLNILKAMKNCLEQIKTTGEADAGACKALFTQYACDLLTWVAVNGALVITSGIDIAGKSEKAPDQMAAGDALKTGITAALNAFKNDYGSAVRLTPDFTMGRITHAVCMFAFTHEWEPGFGGLFGADVEGPPRQSSVIIIPAERELLGYDPITGKAYFEYKVAVSFTAGSNIRYYDVNLICDADGDCPGTPKPRLFRSEPEIKSGRIADIKINEFSSVQGTIYVDNEDWRFNKVKVCWYTAETRNKADYEDCETVDIIPALGSDELAECGFTPAAALGGNDLFRCKVLQTQTSAHFSRALPQRHIMVVSGDNQQLDVPFAIEAMYETPEEEALPMLLQVEEVTADGKFVQAPNNPQSIPDGTNTEAYFTTALPPIKYADVFKTAGTSLTTVKPEKPADKCTASSISEGVVPKSAAFTVIFPETGAITNKNVYIDDGGAYGLSVYRSRNANNCDSSVQACCGENNENCKIENNVLILKMSGAEVKLKAENGAKCVVTVTSKGGGTEIAQTTKYYKYSIHRNNGEGGLGSVVYVGDQEQEFIVEVILKKGTETATTTTTAEAVTFTGSLSPSSCPVGQPCSLSGITVTGTHLYLNYYVEDAVGMIKQNSKQIQFTQTPSTPTFVIDSKDVIDNAVTYSLKVQAAYVASDKTTRVQTQTYNFNVGSGTTPGGTAGTTPGGG